MQSLAPYSILQKYTLAELEAYWENFDKTLFKNSMFVSHMLTVLMGKLFELRTTDPAVATHKIKTLLIAMLTGAAEKKVESRSVRAARGHISIAIQYDAVRAALLADEDGRYALATYVLDRALANSYAHEKKPLTPGSLFELSSFMRIARNLTYAEFELNPDGPSLIGQVSPFWMMPAWCALIAPGLLTFDDVIKEVWVSRPALVYPAYEVEINNTSAAPAFPAF